jgi:hypothetical protein
MSALPSSTHASTSTSGMLGTIPFALAPNSPPAAGERYVGTTERPTRLSVRSCSTTGPQHEEVIGLTRP